jgi:transcriptional regulator with XRE-family HTH domain
MQIRAARAALGWSIDELAQKSGISARTIKRFEAFNGVPPSRTSTLMNVQAALEGAGIEFTGAPDDCPGIRLRARKSE